MHYTEGNKDCVWSHPKTLRNSGQSRFLHLAPFIFSLSVRMFLDFLFCLWDTNCSFPSLRYIVMSGTPEKILEHFLETMRLEATLNEATGAWQQLYCCGCYYCVKSCWQCAVTWCFEKKLVEVFPRIKTMQWNNIIKNIENIRNPGLKTTIHSFCSIVFIPSVLSRTAESQKMPDY